MSIDSSNPLHPIEVPSVERPVVSWNPLLAVFFVIVLYFASQLLAGILLSVYPSARHWTHNETTEWLNNSVGAQFAYVVLAEGLTLVGLQSWLRHFRSSFRVIGLIKPRWRDLGYALLAAPIYYIVYALLLAAATQATHIDINQQQQIGFSGVHGALPLVLTFISLVILPPLTEEILMRGFLFTSLKKAMPVIVAALVTSAIFASAHLPEGGSGGPLWVAAIDTFTLSLVLCYLRQKTGSLWSSITLHALKNGVAFIALFILHVQ